MQETQEITTESAEETQKLGEEIAKTLQPNQQQRATIIALYGDLGGGKTTFTQGFARGLDIEEPVRSPTFLIMKVFELQNIEAFTKLIHIDAYRLETSEEMKRLNWDDMVKDNKALILIEWADKIADLLPKDSIKLQFEFIDENTRRITLKGFTI